MTGSKLSPKFLAPYYARGDNFPNLLARSVYLSKYCRDRETWTDTIRRVVEGNVALDPAVTVVEAEALFDAFWNMKILPSGRGLFSGGVPGIPVASRVNCWYVTLRSISDWEWQCNRLLEGGGVGVGLGEIDLLPGVVANPRASLTVLCSKSHPNEMECMPDKIVPNDSTMYLVSDSREGWASALRAVLEAAFAGVSITVNVSGVRSRGEPIRTFGGVAPGPGPLVTMLRNVWSVVRGCAGAKLGSVDCLDVVNMIGSCIRSGGIRRSAIIQFGEIGDRGFREAKRDYAKLMSHRSSSNNSIIFRSEMSLDKFDWKELVNDCAERGEPGFFSLWLARQTDDSVEGANPCQPGWATVLTPEGVRTFDEISVGSVIWSGERWTHVTKKWYTGVKPVYEYLTVVGEFIGTENHHIVQRGIKVQVKDATHIDRSSTPERQYDETCEIRARRPLGDFPVYDITVDADEHTYWTGGLLVSNCNEATLANYDSCNLSNAFPSRFGVDDDYQSLFVLITRYTLRQRLESFVDVDAEAVRAQYMRIGVGLGGLCDFDWTRASLSQMYRWVREEATHYAHELGVNTPRTCTVVKPDGSVGTMVGSSSGIHAAFAPFYVRRIRIMDREPMHAALVDAGVPYEQCVYDKSGHTSVFELPMRAKAAVYTATESVTSQIERVVAVQESYTDQMVSSTISFGEEEKDELEANLRKYGKRLKGMSMLPRGHSYEQSPYTECTEEEYVKRVSTVRENHPLVFSDDAFEIECGTGGNSCPVR